jgi:tetratricopeptide (TPR) repeat protein
LLLRQRRRIETAEEQQQKNSDAVKLIFNLQEISAMSTKTLLISSVLFGVLLFMAAGVWFADTSELLEQADTYKQEGNYEQAEAIYQQIVTDYPDTDYAFLSQKNLAILYVLWDNQPEADAALGQLVTDFYEHTGISQAVWQIAKEYEQKKKYDKALELHQYNVENYSTDMHAMWSQVEIVYSLIESGDDAAADTACDKLITVFSEQETLPKEIHQIAMKYNSLERYNKALELHQYNVGHSSKYDTYTMWSQVEIVESHIRDANDAAADAACDMLLSAFSEQPTLPKEVYLIADLHSKAGRDNKALTLHQYNVEQLSMDDKYTMWSLVEIIKSHMQNADVDAADAACDILLDKFSKQPAFPTELYQIAMRYKKSGRNEKALELHKYNIEHSSRDDKYTMWSKVEIVKSHIRDANDIAADEAFGELLAEFSGQPTLPKEIYQIVDEYVMAGSYDKADQVYQQVLDNWPDAREAGLEHIGVAEINVLSLIESGNDTAAREALDILIADFNEHPDLAWTLDGIAGRYEKVQKYDEARSIYQKIVTDYNETDYAFTAQKKLAILEITAGDDIAAQAALEILIADFNDHTELPQTLLSISEQYFYRNNYQRATELWELMLSKYPESSVIEEILYFLAVCYEKLKDDPNATKYYTKLVEQHTNGRYAYRAPYSLALIYRRQKHYDKAIYWFQQQRRLYLNEPYRERALFCEGLVYLYKLKVYEKAAEIFQEYIDTYPTGKRHLALYRLAVCYEQMGKKAQAIELLQQGLMEYSDTVFAETYMEKLMQLQ